MFLILTPARHASIDAATRQARGLPEDLIRLCVGIEDPIDLLDDLEHALLEAGAITIEQGVEGHHYLRATLKREGYAISRAVEKLAYNELERPNEQHKDSREWFVSAPGKAILFGEHAVVHGVVSCMRDFLCHGPTHNLDCVGCISGPSLLWTDISTVR